MCSHRATGGVYCIRHSGKVYVGSSVCAHCRLRTHRQQLGQGLHPNRYLQRAYAKAGGDGFSFRIIEFAPRRLLTQREQYWMDTYRATDRACGYNAAPHAHTRPDVIHRPPTDLAWRRRLSAHQPQRKLSHAQAAALRADRPAMTLAALAAHYHVSIATVSKILAGTRYLPELA